MEKVRSVKSRTKKPYKKKTRRHFDSRFKLRLIKLHLEESVPVGTICEESGVGRSSLLRWIRAYRKHGEASLEPRSGGSRKKRLPEPVHKKIVELKKSHPLFGIKRISQVMRRVFLMPASPETVRKTLHESSLMSPPTRKKPQRNITRPRFFERATPNQLWQTDIFTFRLGGHYAYLIGYIDDYSRYITGLDLFRSQTGEHVLEIYRRASKEYNPPKEMLTDNGRQYTSWRGNTRFEAELKKDHVHHIKSQPHHPMTLGKIERFWKTIYLEFLSRAQFDSFENAQERIRLWVRYYNHKRPHQGIGGLCPADRYFEIQSELRKTIERGIQENLLEMALRGKPRDPFYMVGRMEGQAVVLRAEKGKLRLTVGDREDGIAQELVYNLQEGEYTYGKDSEGQNGQDAKEAVALAAHGSGQMQGGAVCMVGTAQAGGSVPGVVDPVGDSGALAEPGHGRDAAGAGTEDKPGPGSCAQPAPGVAYGEAVREANDAGAVGHATGEGS
jgi:transposase InsO family protein